VVVLAALAYVLALSHDAHAAVRTYRANGLLVANMTTPAAHTISNLHDALASLLAHCAPPNAVALAATLEALSVSAAAATAQPTSALLPFECTNTAITTFGQWVSTECLQPLSVLVDAVASAAAANASADTTNTNLGARLHAMGACRAAGASASSDARRAASDSLACVCSGALAAATEDTWLPALKAAVWGALAALACALIALCAAARAAAKAKSRRKKRKFEETVRCVAETEAVDGDGDGDGDGACERRSTSGTSSAPGVALGGSRISFQKRRSSRDAPPPRNGRTCSGDI